jgi:cell fate regulator YaaT (PSP1 superfamily)
MSETPDTELAAEPVAQLPYLIGVRMRVPLQAEDHLTDHEDLAVGDFVVVETGQGTAVGEIRRPKRPLPEFKRGRLYRQVVRRATEAEVAEWRERRDRELQHAEVCRRRAKGRGLRLKVVDVEIDPKHRRVTVLFNAEDRVDFRDLVRDLAHEFHARIEMRQIGARDTTKLMDGIGPCGRQLCCSSYLKKFDPISVKMAKAQDMPLTDSRLLGNCGRLKCCLLYEFSTYDQLRKLLPKVGSACQADCGGQGCMTGKVRGIRVLKQTVVVGFQDGTESEVPLEALTWEGRPHIQPL